MFMHNHDHCGIVMCCHVFQSVNLLSQVQPSMLPGIERAHRSADDTLT